MKRYKVNGKVVVADSLREAIVKYRDAQNYSVGQKFRDPKGRIWEVKSVNGDLLTIAVDGKEMSNKLHKEIFAEWAKTWGVEDSIKDFLEPKIGQKYRGKVSGGILQVIDIYTEGGQKWVRTIDLKTGYKKSTNYPTFIRLLLEPINDSTDSVEDSEADEIAKRIRNSSQWNEKDIKRLCELAGLSKEWQNANGENFESVVYQAAKRLGVDIDDSVEDSVKDYDDEYYEIRYEFTFNGVKRTAKVLVKAKAETDAKSKFANDKTRDGTEKILSVKKLSEDEVKKLIGYGVYVIDGVIKTKQDIINAVNNSQMMKEALQYNTKDKLRKSPTFVYHVKNLINKIAFDSEYELTVKEEAEILNEVLYK